MMAQKARGRMSPSYRPGQFFFYGKIRKSNLKLEIYFASSPSTHEPAMAAALLTGPAFTG